MTAAERKKAEEREKYEALENADYPLLVKGTYSVDIGATDVAMEISENDMSVLRYWSGERSSAEIIVQHNPERITTDCFISGKLEPYQYNLFGKTINDFQQFAVKMPYWQAKEFISEIGYKLDRSYTLGWLAKFGNSKKQKLGRDYFEEYSPPEIIRDNKFAIEKLLKNLKEAEIIIPPETWRQNLPCINEKMTPIEYEMLKAANYETLHPTMYEKGLVYDVFVDVSDNDISLLQFCKDDIIRVNTEINAEVKSWPYIEPFQYTADYSMAKLPYGEIKEFLSELGYGDRRQFGLGKIAKFYDRKKPQRLGRVLQEIYYPTRPILAEEKQFLLEKLLKNATLVTPDYMKKLKELENNAKK